MRYVRRILGAPLNDVGHLLLLYHVPETPVAHNHQVSLLQVHPEYFDLSKLTELTLEGDIAGRVVTGGWGLLFRGWFSGEGIWFHKVLFEELETAEVVGDYPQSSCEGVESEEGEAERGGFL